VAEGKLLGFEVGDRGYFKPVDIEKWIEKQKYNENEDSQ